jgi:4-hydroxy-3-methylbut-2-enyl diphosphate reductase
LKVLIAPNAGFCFGVRRAIDMAQRAAAERGKVFSLGPLIHNRQAVEALREQGVEPAEELDEVPHESTVMIRTHGAGPDVYAAIAERGQPLLDSTCPFVMRAHTAASRFHQEGYQVLVLGDREHPESQGIVAHTGGAATIVSDPSEAVDLRLGAHVAIVCQTTQRLENLLALVTLVLPHVQELRVANTICDATAQRQRASEALAAEVDVTIIVGGYHSANTRRLAEICAETGTPTHHIETADELDPDWVRGAEVVGVTAGASTPDEAIRAVAEAIAEIGGPGSEIVTPPDSGSGEG